MLKDSLATKVTYGTLAYSETSFTLPSTSYNYAVKHSGTYCLTIFSGSSTTHDVSISIAGINLGSGYLGYQYDRLNVQVPLWQGTQITINGAIGDGIIITYL